MQEKDVRVATAPYFLDQLKGLRAPDPAPALKFYGISKASRDVQLLDKCIIKKIQAGDCRGIEGLAKRYGMPYRVEYLTAAISSGHVDIVKLLVKADVSTAKALEDCVRAPRENVEILEFLIESKAKLDYPHIRYALGAGYMESARRLLEYDSSGQYLRIAAEDIGMSSDGGTSIKNLCSILPPDRHREILEYGLQGALRRGNEAVMAELFSMGAQGDRLFWSSSALTKNDDRLKAVCEALGVALPLPLRFPLAWGQSGDTFKQLLVKVSEDRSFLVSASPDDDCPPSHMRKLRMADEALTDLTSKNIISAPLLETFDLSLVSAVNDACHRNDGDELRAVVAQRPEILEPRFYLLEQLVASGSVPLVKILVEEFGADVHQHDEMSLAMAAHQGYVDVLQYLIGRGANVHARQGAALSEAARMSNAEVVKEILKHGADPRDHRSKAVYDCIRQANPLKQTAALRAAKLLVDAGASPKFLSPSPPYDDGPAMQYVRFIMEISSPQSPLYLKTLEPRLKNSHINFSQPSYSLTPIFGFASSCAAVAARLFATPESPKLFIALFKNGMSKVLDEGIGTFANLRTSCNVDIDLFQDTHDVAAGVLWDVIVPTIVSRPEMLPKDFENIIIGRANSLAFVVGHELFANRSVNEILKFSQLWHRPDAQLPLDAKPLRVNANWYPLIPRVDLGDGFTIEALTTNEELLLEGSILHHCLRGGGFGAKCLNGQTHILSIRKNGIPRATAEISEVSRRRGIFALPSGRQLALIQVRADGNSALDMEFQRRFDAFVAKARQGDVQLWDGTWGETPASREAREKLNISLLEGMTGIRNGEYPTRAVEHYEKVLSVPGAQRGASGRVPKIGLLDPQLTERIIDACKGVLAGPPDEVREKRSDIDLSEVKLTRRPSRATLLAWEFQERCENVKRLLLQSIHKSPYADMICQLQFPETSSPRFREGVTEGRAPHEFFE